jgi:hypothetical protein
MKWKSLPRVNSYLILFISGILLSSFSLAQKTVKVNGIKGVSVINDLVSLKDAKIDALNDAKLNALKKAGVVENINAYQILMSIQQERDFSQYFSSGILTNLQGAILNYQVINDYNLIKKSDIELSVEVIINAEVILYETVPDDAFDVKVDGIKNVYNNNEVMSFSVSSTSDCFLNVFNWVEKDASLMYPNKFEQSILIEKGKKIEFPLNKINYTMQISDGAKTEKSKLIFVFTKKKLEFIDHDEEFNTSTEKVLSWVSSILPDQKKVFYKSILIQ